MKNLISFFSSYFLLLEVLLEKLTPKQTLYLIPNRMINSENNNRRGLHSERTPARPCTSTLINTPIHGGVATLRDRQPFLRVSLRGGCHASPRKNRQDYCPFLRFNRALTRPVNLPPLFPSPAFATLPASCSGRPAFHDLARQSPPILCRFRRQAPR